LGTGTWDFNHARVTWSHTDAARPNETPAKSKKVPSTKTALHLKHVLNIMILIITPYKLSSFRRSFSR
jgi:hypothetical protein